MKHRFITPLEIEHKVDNHNVVEFFQISAFKDPQRNKHHIRRFIINDNSDTINMLEYYVGNKVYNKLINSLPINRFRSYDTLNLNDIESPSISDILLSDSELLNNKYY